jgi:hypothetical protein
MQKNISKLPLLFSEQHDFKSYPLKNKHIGKKIDTQLRFFGKLSTHVLKIKHLVPKVHQTQND